VAAGVAREYLPSSKAIGDVDIACLPLEKSLPEVLTEDVRSRRRAA